MSELKLRPPKERNSRLCNRKKAPLGFSGAHLGNAVVELARKVRDDAELAFDEH